MFKRTRLLLLTALLAAGLQVVPSPAEAVDGSVTCGSRGKAAFNMVYARHRGLLAVSKGPGPTARDDVSVRISPATLVGDPVMDNAYGLPETGIWTFVGNLPNISFGGSQATSGGTFQVQSTGGQCTGQAAPTGTTVESIRDSHVSCAAGSRVVAWSDGWGNHWVQYRSTATGPLRRVKTMWSNYGTLKMGSLFIDEREVFDVKLFATTSKPPGERPERFLHGDIRCNSDGQDPKLH